MAESILGRLPAPRAPIIDGRTGAMSREWYRFFLSLFEQVETDTAEVIPDFDEAPLPGEAAFLGLAASLTDELGLIPVQDQPLPKYYGDFYDTTTQTAAVINTAYAVTFDTTRSAFGVRRGGTTSQIIFDSPGVYKVDFRAQVDKTSAGTGSLWLWGRQGGVDIAQSATIVEIQGSAAEVGVSWSFLVTTAAADYFELVWATSSTAIQLQARAAAAPVPAIPSVTLTVTPVA